MALQNPGQATLEECQRHAESAGRELTAHQAARRSATGQGSTTTPQPDLTAEEWASAAPKRQLRAGLDVANAPEAGEADANSGTDLCGDDDS